jgi:hypothetical protein
MAEPPYDEVGPETPHGDTGSAGAATQGTLALAFVLPSGVPAEPRLRLVPPADEPPTAGAATAAPGLTPAAPRTHVAPTAAPHPAAPQRLQPSAVRPAGRTALRTRGVVPQLPSQPALPEPRQWAGRFIQALVEVLGGVRPATQLVRWTTDDVYADIRRRAEATRTATNTRGHVRSVHVGSPADGVAEVCALVQRGPRATAVALRLEGTEGRWQCTALELG